MNQQQTEIPIMHTQTIGQQQDNQKQLYEHIWAAPNNNNNNNNNSKQVSRTNLRQQIPSNSVDELTCKNLEITKQQSNVHIGNNLNQMSQQQQQQQPQQIP